jgi:hypothetical protein
VDGFYCLDQGQTWSLANIIGSTLGDVDLEVSWYGKEYGAPENILCFAAWTPEYGLQTDEDAAIRCQKAIYRV